MSYILAGESRKKEKPADINVTVFLLPERVAVGTRVKEKNMRDGNGRELVVWHSSACTLFRKITEKLKKKLKNNYLVLKRMLKDKYKMNSSVSEYIMHYYLS